MSLSNVLIFSVRHLPFLCSGKVCSSALPFSEIRKVECDISLTDYEPDIHLSFSLGGTRITLQVRTVIDEW